MSVQLDYLAYLCVFVWEIQQEFSWQTRSTPHNQKGFNSLLFMKSEESTWSLFTALYSVRVCFVCALVCVWVCGLNVKASGRGGLSCESGVDASTGRQSTDSSGNGDKVEETAARCFCCCALWVWGLIHRSGGGTSSLGVSMKRTSRNRFWRITLDYCGWDAEVDLQSAVLCCGAWLMRPGWLCCFWLNRSVLVKFSGPWQTGVLLVLKSAQLWLSSGASASCWVLLLAVRTGFRQY